MNIGNEVHIDAPPSVVWDVFTDVERWPEWTRSVREASALDGPGIALGQRFAITQPRLPRLVWEVTEVTPGASWSWHTRSFGAETVASHELVAGADGTVVRQRITYHGPIGLVSGVVMHRLTRRYLALEAAGLKGRVEEARRTGAAPA